MFKSFVKKKKKSESTIITKANIIILWQWTMILQSLVLHVSKTSWLLDNEATKARIQIIYYLSWSYFWYKLGYHHW